jgi:hypothetical protein
MTETGRVRVLVIGVLGLGFPWDLEFRIWDFGWTVRCQVVPVVTAVQPAPRPRLAPPSGVAQCSAHVVGSLPKCKDG